MEYNLKRPPRMELARSSTKGEQLGKRVIGEGWSLLALAAENTSPGKVWVRWSTIYLGTA
jgi:hypothetical protein